MALPADMLMEVHVDSEAMRPRFQPPEDFPHQLQDAVTPAAAGDVPELGPDRSVPLMLPRLKRTESASEAELGADVISLVDSAAIEVLPAPASTFVFAPLARYQRLERIVNVLIAAFLLVVAAPLMLLVALAVKLTSKGPILYRQPRVGLDRRGVRLHSRRRSDRRWQLWARFLETHDDLRARDLGGAVFMIYKFRTMCEDAEKSTGAVWAVKNDPRSTPIGCFLRKYRLDELPQLINVIKGDMNIVGPRPERPSIFARLSEEVESYPLRQRAKPGITGWAQINLLYDSCIEDVRKKVRYDLEYLRQRNLLRDLKIMVKTVPSILFKRRGW